MRRRAAFVVLHRVKEIKGDELSLQQKMNVILREDWRGLPDSHDELIKGLVVAMVADTTDLLAVSIIGQAIATAGEDGLTELLPLLSHDAFWIRAYAAAGIGTLDNGARWAVPSLCRALSLSDLDWTGQTIIRALGSIGGPAALDFLHELAIEERASSPLDLPLLQALEEALASARSQE